jgi:hypothetical protein
MVAPHLVTRSALPFTHPHNCRSHEVANGIVAISASHMRDGHVNTISVSRPLGLRENVVQSTQVHDADDATICTPRWECHKMQ